MKESAIVSDSLVSVMNRHSQNEIHRYPELPVSTKIGMAYLP
jgi:hypothetical protein